MKTDKIDDIKIEELRHRATKEILYRLLDNFCYGNPGWPHMVSVYVNEDNEDYPRYLTCIDGKIPYHLTIGCVSAWNENRMLIYEVGKNCSRILVNIEKMELYTENEPAYVRVTVP